MAHAAHGQTLPPFPEDGRGVGVYDPDVAAKAQAYGKALRAEWKACQRAAFEHDLQNLAALNDIVQQREIQARQQEIQNLQASGKFSAPGAVEKDIDRQRGTNSPYGQRYSDSVSLSKELAWYRSFKWGHCLPKQTSMTTSPGGGPDQQYAANTTGFAGGVIGLDYAHFNPSFGSNGDQWGVGGAALFHTTPSLGLQVEGGYHNVSSSGPHLDNWTAGGAVVWDTPNWRVGPAVGYQNNSQAGYSASTFNYGGFAEFRTHPGTEWDWQMPVSFEVKGGGFSTDHHGGSGAYLGLDANIYPMPNLVIGGGIDYTRFNRFSGSHETDYTLGGEYLLPSQWPVAIYGGYSYSDFSPGSFHVNTLFAGVKLYFNGNGARTLVDRHETGALPFSPNLTALQLRF